MDLMIEKAKQLLPMPRLLEKLGDATVPAYAYSRGRFKISSPLRSDDRDPSFSCFMSDSGHCWRWRDHGRDTAGDELDYLQARDGLSFQDAKRKFLDLAGVAHEESQNNGGNGKSQKRVVDGKILFRAGNPERTTQRKVEPTPEPKRRVRISKSEPQRFDWQACIDAFGEDRMADVAEWRGYDIELVRWLRDQGLMGWYDGDRVAMPVYDDQGNPIAAHCRTIEDPKSWRNLPSPSVKSENQVPLTVGDPTTSSMVIVCESQWDMFAAAQLLTLHRNPDALAQTAMVATRGVNVPKPVAEIVRPAKERGAVVIGIQQNDKPLAPGEKERGNWAWRKNLAQTGVRPAFCAPPESVKDTNDWLIQGVTGEQFLDTLMKARPIRTARISMRSVSELLAMEFDDSDCYLGDRMLAAGQPTSFLGPGGIGKSRLVLQLAVCGVLGVPFLDFETQRMRGKKWLFLQTENSNRRLRADLDRVIRGLGLGKTSLSRLDQGLVFHTLENDLDTWLDLESQEGVEHVQAAIYDHDPDIVVFDPLNTFTSGDLNSDRDCRSVLTTISQLVRAGNPDRIPFVVHHSLTGKAGASRAVGWDRGSYGRNSKALFAWVRSQWNLAPADPDDPTRLLLACGKNNNGKQFEDTGLVFDEDTGLYRKDEAFDPEEFRESVGADTPGAKKQAGRKGVSLDRVVACMDSRWMNAGAIQRLVSERLGCAESTFYKYWRQARAEPGLIEEKEENGVTLFRPGAGTRDD